MSKWLKQFPDETEVKVGIQTNGGNWEPFGPVSFEDINITSEENNSDGTGWEFFDSTQNRFIKNDHPLFGKKILFIGESC